MRELTTDERKILDLSDKLFEALEKLPTRPPSDLVELAFHVHSIQNAVLARPAYESLQPESPWGE